MSKNSWRKLVPTELLPDTSSSQTLVALHKKTIISFGADTSRVGHANLLVDMRCHMESVVPELAI